MAFSLTGDASAAAFPLGGIGTGNVSLGARGELRDWEIFNSSGRGNTLPFTFFSIRAAPVGDEARCRILESRLRPPHGERPFGYLWWDAASLPRMAQSELRGEYPFVQVDFIDDELPVSVGLEAFTPLVPLDAAESGLPAAVVRYNVCNETESAVDVTVAGSLANAVGFDGFELGLFPRFVGQPRNQYRDDGTVRGLFLTSSLPNDHLKHGTMALTTGDGNVSAKPEWQPQVHAGLIDFWNDLREDGRLTTTPDLIQGSGSSRLRMPVGSLGISGTLSPGETKTFEFLLTWHFPNRPAGWVGWPGLGGINSPDRKIVRNFYATWLSDAWHVSRYLHDNLPRLERDSRAFHRSLWDGTLPAEVVDAAAANIAVVRSTYMLQTGKRHIRRLGRQHGRRRKLPWQLYSCLELRTDRCLSFSRA